MVLDRRGKLKFPESIAKPRSEMPKRIWISLFLFCFSSKSNCLLFAGKFISISNFSVMIYENEDILLCLESKYCP